MFGGCLHVGVTKAPKNTQMAIGWRLVVCREFHAEWRRMGAYYGGSRLS
jgi:hypothetical protein